MMGSRLVDLGIWGLALGVVGGILPLAVGFLSVLLLVLRIWESETVRGWTNRQRK